MEQPFERVIGLGSFCSVKYHINMYFTSGQSGNITRKGFSDLFDWLFIHDYNMLAYAFQNNFEDLFNPNDIYVFENTHTIVNRKYTMSWNHIYNTHLLHRIIPITYDQLIEDLSLIKTKLEHNIKKMFNANMKKVLYIIDSTYTTINNEILNKLYISILKYRNNNNFKILLLYVDEKFPEIINNFDNSENGYIFRKIPYTSNYTDFHNKWTEIFNEFSFDKSLFNN